MGKTTRAIEARRLKFTPELLANVRRRFEGSDEPLSTMAADLGCCKTSLRGIAQREGWVRYERRRAICRRRRGCWKGRRHSLRSFPHPGPRKARPECGSSGNRGAG